MNRTYRFPKHAPKLVNLLTVATLLFGYVFQPIVIANQVFAQENSVETPIVESVESSLVGDLTEIEELNSTKTLEDDTPQMGADTATPTEDGTTPMPPQTDFTPDPTSETEIETLPILPELEVAEEPEEETAQTPEWVMLDANTYITGSVVEIGKLYTAPQNKDVNIEFTKLPTEAGKLTISVVYLSDQQKKDLGAYENLAYEFTTTMSNGSFKYNLSLPNPHNASNAVVKYADSMVELSSSPETIESVNKYSGVVAITGLNHFSVYVTAAPTSASQEVFGGTTWINQTNIYISDNNRARTHMPMTVESYSDRLIATGFDFGSIPLNANITGITVSIEASSHVNSTVKAVDYEVRLVKGGVVVGDNLATNTGYTTTEQTRVYGSDSNLWGESWLPTDFNSSFGVAFRSYRPAGSPEEQRVRIDYIDIEVHYNIPPVVAVGFPNGGELFQGGTIQTITWSAIDPDYDPLFDPTMDTVLIEYTADDGHTWTSIDASAPNTGTYDWTLPLITSDQVMVRVTGFDGIDYGSDESNEVSIIDSTAPAITEGTPIAEYTNDSTPEYSYISDEAGTVVFGGSCSSVTTDMVVGENTIVFDALADGVYNLCTITPTDAAGNTGSTLFVSEFTVDTVLPTDPTSFSSDPLINTPTNDNSILISWSGASDDNSGVNGFSYSLTNGETDVPDTARDSGSESTSHLFEDVADGTWYFHIRTLDNAGNWTSTAHYGPFLIDTVAPSVPTGLEWFKQGGEVVACGGYTNERVGANWADNPESDLHHYEYNSFNPPTGSIWGGPGPLYISEFTPWWWAPSNATYGFRVRAVDNAGNASDWTSLTMAESCLFTYDDIVPVLTYDNDVEAGPVINDTVTVSVVDTNPDTSTYFYGYSADNVCDATDTYDNTFDSGVGFTITNEAHNGEYVCAKAVDLAGNTSYLSSTNAFNVDITGPVLTDLSVWGVVDGYTGYDFGFNSFISADGFGVDTATCESSIDGGTTWQSASYYDGGPSCDAHYFGLADGTVVTLQLRVQDLGGNYGYSDTQTFTVDVVAPVTTLDDFDSYYGPKKPVDITGSSYDEKSGVFSTCGGFGDVEPLGDGPTTLALVEEIPAPSECAEVIITVQRSSDGKYYDSFMNRWFAGFGMVMPSPLYQDGDNYYWSFTMPNNKMTNGVTYTVTAFSVDQVGNYEMTEAGPKTFVWDSKAPVTTITAIDGKTPSPDNSAIYVNGDIQIDGNTVDALSGVDEIRLRIRKLNTDGSEGAVKYEEFMIPDSEGNWSTVPVSLAEGKYFIRIRSTDNVGNTSWVTEKAFIVDNQAPTIALDPTSATYNEGDPSVEFTLTATDDQDLSKIYVKVPVLGITDWYAISSSGTTDTLKEIVPMDSSVIEEDSYEVYFYSEDSAGNVSPVLTQTYTLNNVTPVVTNGAYAYTVNEGEALIFANSSFTDPSKYDFNIYTPDDSPWTITVDYGDGTAVYSTTTAETGSFPIPDHTYLANGTYQVAVTVCEFDGEHLPEEDHIPDGELLKTAIVSEIETGPTEKPLMKGEGQCHTDYAIVTVIDNPVGVSVAPVSSSVLRGSAPVTITATTINGNAPFTYAWTGCTETGVNSDTATVSTASTGTFVCNVTVTDADGDTAQAGATVVVNAVPLAPLVNAVQGASTSTDATTTEETATTTEEVLGEQTCETKSKLFGYLYFDKNENGSRDDGEEGLMDIEVQILAGDKVVGTAKTNADGYWQIDLCPGEYKIMITKTELPSNVRVDEGGDFKLVTIDQENTEYNVNVKLIREVSFLEQYWWILVLIVLVGLGGYGYYLQKKKGM